MNPLLPKFRGVDSCVLTQNRGREGVRLAAAKPASGGEFMSVESPSLFAQAIQEHLELKQRNADLDPEMPLDVYKSEDPFENHPLFKTEEQARLEESLWGRESRDFDWGD